MSIQAFTLFGTVELKGDKVVVSGLKNVSLHVNTTEKDLKKLRDEIDRTSKSQSNFSKGFLSSFGIQRGQGFGAFAGNQAGNMIQWAIQKLTGHITDAWQSGMDFADKVQAWKFGFTSLMNNEAKGIAHLRDLLKFGKDSSFATEDVIDYAQGLEAVRVKAKELIPMLEGMGGALAKAGKFNRENLFGTYNAIQQILSKRQVSAEEMQRQLGQYIPDPYGYAARGFNRLGYRDDQGNEFTSATMRELSQDGRLNADAFVRIMVDQFREESKGLLEKFVSGTVSGARAQRDDTMLFLFGQSVLGGGDLLGPAGGAYKQYLENLKTQTGIYGGPEAKKIGAGLGTGAQLYYKALGFGEQHMFDINMLSPGMMLANQLMPFDKAKELGKTIGPYLPEGLREGLITGAQGLQEVAKKVMGEDLYNSLAGFWETNSPSERTRRVGQWIREGLELGLTMSQARTYANMKALSEKDPEFLRTLGLEAGKRGVNPDDMLNLIGIESRFNKSVVNQWGYGGLGQVGRDERKALGLPVDDAAFKRLLEEKSASWQLSNVLFPFLDMKLKANKSVLKDGTIDLSELYAMWGSGHATGDPNSIHMARGGKRASAYANNPLWDYNKDGVVRESEFGQAALASLGAGKFFSINGAPVAKSNPMPVQVIDYGNSVAVNLKTGRPLGERVRRTPTTIKDDVPVNVDIVAAAEQVKTSTAILGESALNLKKPLDSLTESASSAVAKFSLPKTINDDVPVNVDVTIGRLEEPLETLEFGLTANALNFKKLAGVTDQVAAAELSRLRTLAGAEAELKGLTKEALEFEYGPAIAAAKKKRKKDPLFDPAYTYEGVAGDFHNNLASLFGNIGWEQPSLLGKEALFNFIRDVQGRVAHDFSSMITEMIFGGRTADGKIMGGLLGRMFGDRPNGTMGGLMAGALGGEMNDMKSPGGFSGFLAKLFGSIFGGFRADGGGMSPGRFYVAGENGPELISGPGHVYNNRQTREMLSRSSGGDTYVSLSLGDRAVADMNDQWIGSRRGMRRMIRINARYGRAVHV